MVTPLGEKRWLQHNYSFQHLHGAIIATVSTSPPRSPDIVSDAGVTQGYLISWTIVDKVVAMVKTVATVKQ